MENNFWEGEGWELVNFGRICEIKLGSGEDILTYMLVFVKESQPYTEKIVSKLAEAEGTVGCLSELQHVLDRSIKELGPRTILTKADLERLNNGKVPIPELYKQALQSNLTKIVLF